MPKRRGLPRGLPVATPEQKKADAGVRISRAVTGRKNDFTADESLTRPASFTTGRPIVGTVAPVRRERLATETARTSAARETPYLPSFGTTRAREGGYATEEKTVRVFGVKRTQVRAVRTEAMGDDPLPVLPYYWK